MTTIAYRDGILATDRLITSGGERCGAYTKGRNIGRLMYASAGSCGLTEAVGEWLRAGARGEPPRLKDGDREGSVYVFLPDHTIVWFHCDGVTPIRAPYWAAGSGGPYALGAMAAGASAKDAVIAAIKHDTGSGEGVETLRIAA